MQNMHGQETTNAARDNAGDGEGDRRQDTGNAQAQAVTPDTPGLSSEALKVEKLCLSLERDIQAALMSERRYLSHAETERLYASELQTIWESMADLLHDIKEGGGS